MKMASFRFRIALWSAFASGLILAIGAVLFLSLVRRIGLERMDYELQALGDAQVRTPKPRGYWEHFDETLVSIYGEQAKESFLVQTLDRDGRILYTSPRWPADISLPPALFPDRSIFLPDPSGEPPPLERFEQEGFGRSAFDRPLLRGRPGQPPRMHMTSPRWCSSESGGSAWRFIVMGNEQVTLVIGMNQSRFLSEVRRFRNTILLAAPGVLLLLAAISWMLAGTAIRPVLTLTQVAREITAEGLDRRVQAFDADQEFQALIDVINGMLDRLQKSFQQATRFSADAAHELKTPLTILCGHLQQAIQETPTGSVEQRRYADLMEEVQRLTGIVRKLLLLAQADSGQLRLSLAEVDLSGEVTRLAEDTEQFGGNLRITREIEPGLCVPADAILFRQAIQNLATNAVKYNRDDGSVDFRLHRQDGRAILTVANTIPPGTRIESDRLFARFYRGDRARNRTVDGLGLGLSLAREIFRAHHGDLSLRDYNADTVTFEAFLPLR